MPVARSRHGHVLLIEMQREDKRNAINPEMARGLDDALNELDDDPQLWAGVLTGTPTVFSAGTDLADGHDTVTERGGSYGIIQRRRTKPLVAAVDGPALGGGFEIVMACDLVVAGPGARFGLPEVTRGVLATCGGLFRTPRVLPLNIAKQLVLTGEPLSVDRAYSLGLVNVIAAEGSTVSEAITLAERICANSPVSVRESLMALNDLVGHNDESGWSATVAATAVVVASHDCAEGVKAFFERRPPQWTGK
jgi:enoyl-CoA hydratase